MDWCPSKDSCKACAVIVSRPENDISKDLPLEELLLKNDKWKRELQQLVISTFDTDQNKIFKSSDCMMNHFIYKHFIQLREL